jgi:hypothetical protein
MGEISMLRFRTAALTALLAAMTAAAVPAGAADTMSGMSMDKARFSDAATYTGAPNLGLTLSMVAAGGGPSSFSSTKLVGTLAGPLTQAEVKSLSDKYGAANVTSFLEVFNFVVSDSLKIAGEKKVSLPTQASVDPSDGKALSAALYTAGVHNGAFDVEYMLDALVSHPIHVQVMNDIDAKYSRNADANYHVVLTQAMSDLKTAYKL